MCIKAIVSNENFTILGENRLVKCINNFKIIHLYKTEDNDHGRTFTIS